MWSAAYGLIALAVVAFVVLYAAAHAPSFKTVNLADQLYNAKKRINDSLPSLPRTDSFTQFAANTNVVAVGVADVAVSNASFPVQFPLGYRLSADGGGILYEVNLVVIRCRRAALQGGAAVTLYAVWLSHSVDALPWLSVYYADVDAAAYYSQLYNLYQTLGRPPTVGLDLPAEKLNKAEWALVYDADSGTAVLYTAAPPSAPYIVVEDYPLKIPLACP